MTQEVLTQESFDAMRKRMSIQAEEIAQLVSQRDMLIKNNEVLEERINTLKNGKLNMEAIVQQEFERLNKEKQGFLAENRRLYEIIDKLKNGE